MTIILQISDPHLLSQSDGLLKGVPTAESFQRVLHHARQKAGDPARVVLSGDLSHEETLAGYELLKGMLGDWTERSLLLPGNHDDRRAMRAVFGQTPGNGDEEIWFREEVGDWLLIGLDSHVGGAAHGELSEKTLQRLRFWLSENAHRPTLLFLHHPPAPVQSEWLDQIGLRNPKPLEKVMQNSSSVRGIFCGHIHQVFEGRLAGVPVYSAPSTAFQFAPKTDELRFDLQPPGFRMIEVREQMLKTWVVRLDETPFIPGDE